MLMDKINVAEWFRAKSPSLAKCKEGDLPLLNFLNLTCMHLHFGYLPTLLTLDNGGLRPHGFTTKICRCLKCWFWILQTLVNRLSCLKKYLAPNPRVFGLFWLCFYVARSPVKTAMSTFVFKGCSKERSLILQITCSERRGIIWTVK